MDTTVSMLWLLLLLLSGDVVPRLVVREEEAASLTLERLRAEAELVGSSRRPHPVCPGVEEDLLEYTFTVLGAAGEETEDTATIATVRDVTIDRKVVNEDEPWIWGMVCIRSPDSSPGHCCCCCPSISKCCRCCC